jgi:thymidylate synthase
VKPKLEQRLCLHLTQRSCDIALGVPYNIAGYAFLLHLMARFTGLKPGIFAHTLVDAHAYTSKPEEEPPPEGKASHDHVPNLKMQLQREPRPLPQLEIADDIQSLDDVERLIEMDYCTEKIMEKFHLRGYDPHPPIKFKVAV